MKTIFRQLLNLIFILFIIIFPLSQVFAQCDKEELITNVLPENAEYLRYIQLYNGFYDAEITYLFGEFRYCTKVKLKHINLDEGLKRFSKVEHGDSTRGIDYKIMNIAKTENFSYDSGSVLKFYRKFRLLSFDTVSRRNECKSQMDMRNWWWYAGKGVVVDSQEFVLQLVRKDNNDAIYCIDSIGLLSNENSCFAIPYGTDPERYNHEIPLPNEFAGMDVYIRLVPKRWGPTPLGMEFISFPMIYNYSHELEFPGDIYNPFHNVNNDFNFSRLKDFISRADSSVLKNVSFPEKLDMFNIDNLGFAFIVGRYLEIYKNSEIMKQEHCIQIKKYNPEAVDSFFSVERYESMKEKYHYSDNNKVSFNGALIDDYGNFKIAINSQCDSIMIIEIINFEGEVLDTIWKGYLNLQEFKYNSYYIKPNNTELIDGYYLYAIRDKSGIYYDFYPCFFYGNCPIICDRMVVYSSKACSIKKQ